MVITADNPTQWVLTLSCIDGPGIVHAISGAVVAAGGNIEESQQFASHDTGRFFMRLQVSAVAQPETFNARFEQATQGQLGGTGIGTFSFDSSEVGGGTSTFVGTITGLSPGTTYEWICNMYYWGGSWIVSDYSDSGTATTYSGGGSGGSAKAVINVGTYYNPNWKRYRAIVNIGTYYNTNWLSVRPVNNYGSYSQPDWR